VRPFVSWSTSHSDQHLVRPTGPPNPFEGWVLVVCVLQGVSVLTGITKPNSIDALLPHGLHVMWAVLLLFGGLAAVGGLYWPGNPVDALLIKRIGLFAAGMGTLAYGFALLTIWPTGLIAALANLGLAAACFHRIFQISTALRNYRTGLQMITAIATASAATALPLDPHGDGEGDGG
jgi:hypothetical protein